MQQDDAFLLLDMLVAARQASKYLLGVSMHQFYADEVLQDAVIHQVQIIGEAASRLSDAFRRSHTEITMGRYCRDASPPGP